MPIYVYGCDTCGNQFEQMQKFQDAPLEQCPRCGAKIRRIMQPAGIVFKGSGWYSTDSRASRSKASPGSTDGTAAPDAKEKDGGEKPVTKEAPKEAPAASSPAAKPAASSSAE